jgi:siroheme synthase
VVTANLAEGATPELARLAGAADTLVVLMAAGKLEELCRALVDAGRQRHEEAAIVEWATTSRQRSVTSTLADLPAIAAAAEIGPPATLVVGPVVGLATTLDWFTGDPADAPVRELARSQAHRVSPSPPG